MIQPFLHGREQGLRCLTPMAASRCFNSWAHTRGGARHSVWRTKTTPAVVSLSKCFSSSSTVPREEHIVPMPLFEKVLIANRGEISCRIIRTCKRLGIGTVAVHSSVDAHACHSKMADERVHIGPAPSLQSYLDIEAVIRAVESTNAQAVHPGYGFLSENPIFSRRLEEHGITFVGPPTSAIELMGDKITSKQIAQEARVNTIPGYDGFITSQQHAVEVANDIGYPVMIKATAGGGGKGMRICWNDGEIQEGYRLSTAEAKSFFGDDRVFIEKFIERPHHIEIQVLAGRRQSTGDPSKQRLEVLCFPERECSIQRRNQKILEESPSVLLKPETRQSMVEQVKRLVDKVGYESAGTVEFLVDEKQNFYFLEMNTRLQVEHPVTEAVTGVDLVELMLQVAAGKGVPKHLLAAADASEDGMVPRKGWAVEARIYAEDPLRGFLPSTGPLLHYQEPPSLLDENDNSIVRVDSGVREGSDISVHYDPMISKLITYGETREIAVIGLLHALDRYVIRGVQHNVPFLHVLCRKDEFLRGDTPTDFIATHYPDGFTGVELTDRERGLLASVLVVLCNARKQTLLQPSLALDKGYNSVMGNDDRNASNSAHFDSSCAIGSTARRTVALGGMFGQLSTFDVTVDLSCGEALARPIGRRNLDEDASDILNFDEQTLKYHIQEVNYHPSNPVVEILVDDKRKAIQVLGESNEGLLSVQMHGAALDAMVMSPEEFQLMLRMKEPPAFDTTDMVQSPMPGTLVSLAVQEGDLVQIGQELCIVEAMKMQNVLRSSRKGKVATVRARVGSSLKADEVIMEYEVD